MRRRLRTLLIANRLDWTFGAIALWTVGWLYAMVSFWQESVADQCDSSDAITTFNRCLEIAQRSRTETLWTLSIIWATVFVALGAVMYARVFDRGAGPDDGEPEVRKKRVKRPRRLS